MPVQNMVLLSVRRASPMPTSAGQIKSGIIAGDPKNKKIEAPGSFRDRSTGAIFAPKYAIGG